MAMNTIENTNEAMVNVQDQANLEAANQQPTTEQTEEKKGFFTKAKEGVKKAWNSKPAKVVKTVALVAGGFGAGLLTANALDKKNGSSEADSVDVEEQSTEEAAE